MLFLFLFRGISSQLPSIFGYLSPYFRYFAPLSPVHLQIPLFSTLIGPVTVCLWHMSGEHTKDTGEGGSLVLEFDAMHAWFFMTGESPLCLPLFRRVFSWYPPLLRLVFIIVYLVINTFRIELSPPLRMHLWKYAIELAIVSLWHIVGPDGLDSWPAGILQATSLPI